MLALAVGDLGLLTLALLLLVDVDHLLAHSLGHFVLDEQLLGLGADLVLVWRLEVCQSWVVGCHANRISCTENAVRVSQDARIANSRFKHLSA